MTGCTWHPLDEGRRRAETLARPNRAYGAWLRRADRLGLSGWAAIRRLGPSPDPITLPGGAEGDRYWLPRHAPGEEWDPKSAPYPEAPRVDFSGSLRPYQESALLAWRTAYGRGVIVAPCGSGKTVLACRALSLCPTPALVLVHTLDLQRQWIERLGQYLPGCEVGSVGGSRKERPGRAVVAVLQSLQRRSRADLEAWASPFGLVVLDEAHHAPASTWSWVLSCCPGRYRLALTATPTRLAGLGEWIEWSAGPIVAQIDAACLQAAGATLVPEIRQVRTGWTWAQEDRPWHEIVSALCRDTERNELIRQEVARETAEGRTTLLLTGRVEHAHLLAGLCGGVALVGDVAAGERARILAGVRSGSIRVLAATQVADEGLDLPELDTVVLAYPDRDSAHVEQRIGRALRPGPGKIARVVDLRDDWAPLLGWARIRDSLYRRKGWNHGRRAAATDRRPMPAAETTQAASEFGFRLGASGRADSKYSGGKG